MRIAIATWTSRQVGGAETYLSRTISSFVSSGHDVALCYESDEPDDRPRVAVPPGVLTLCVTDLGASTVLERLRGWGSDVIYVHGLLDPDLEARVQSVAPAVFFGHAYYGTCISGDKAHRFPVVQPCARRFGAACLALYYPRRCGGLNPVTFARDYRRQRRRLRLLKRYAAVLTHSEHMRQEYLRHGAAGGRVFNCSVTADSRVNMLVQPPPISGDAAASLSARGAPPPLGHPSAQTTRAGDPGAVRSGSPLLSNRSPFGLAGGGDSLRPSAHLVFAGRMDPLKGGEQLLQAVAAAHARLDLPLRVTLAGDGSERSRWERIAREVSARRVELSIHFTGWLGPAGVARLLATADILVMPSLWPEPFGLIGQEANRQGVPVVAYATGGIPEWLVDGLNGCLAPGDPPTVSGLADALVRCLSDRPRHRAMRRAAVVAGHSRPDDLHIATVLDVLQQVAAQRRTIPVVAFAR